MATDKRYSWMLMASLLALPACATAGSGTSALFSLENVDGDPTEVGAQAETDVVVLAFWATWCQPCQSEMTKMSTMYEQLSARGLRLYAINIDAPDTQPLVAPWVAREGYKFPVLLDSETEILSRYHQNGEIPYYVVLDSRGMVLQDHQGYTEGDVEKLHAYLDSLLPAG